MELQKEKKKVCPRAQVFDVMAAGGVGPPVYASRNPPTLSAVSMVTDGVQRF